MKQFERLAAFCQEQNIEYNENIDHQFETFFEMLSETNKVMNLTAVTEKQEVEMLHFIDSLEAVTLLQDLCHDQKDVRIIDIGTGAGFPGIPLAIVCKQYHFTLMDSLNKRIGFIRNVVSAMGIQNVEAVQSRAEDAGQGQYREHFDICVSRAVANIAVLFEYMLPLVKTGGYCILYKSGEYKQELEQAQYAMKTLGGSLYQTETFTLPGNEIKRSLLVIQKVQTTPEKYPRKAGKPSKAPLISK